MKYKEVLEYLYSSLPMYQRIGKKAYKKDLTNTLALAKALGNPHSKFKSIHIAGTNGKGSTAHLLSSILQENGHKVGLYTSPHLKSFRERIRLNGEMVPEDFVVSFVIENKKLIEKISPSFFEITVVMALAYFASEKVDIAIIETGLGGRLDSTNIIEPLVSVITSISLDHEDMLGDSIAKIAFEKAGIIKKNTPVVTGRLGKEAMDVVATQANSKNAPLLETKHYKLVQNGDANFDLITTGPVFHNLKSELKGKSFELNVPIVFGVIETMKGLGWQLSDEVFKVGIQKVVTNTNLKGRWQILSEKPTIVCDIGHNAEAIKDLMQEISQCTYRKLHIVWGMVNDKSIARILDLMIQDAEYYFCQANVPRALNSTVLRSQAAECGLNGSIYASVSEAYDSAREKATTDDMIFIGGSTFVVAEIEDI